MLVIVVSAAIVRWTNTRPGYDPYGWLIWGYQTLHLHLDLGGAPSWKPLPLLFTVPFSLFGHYALWLWMVTAEAAAFAGSIFAGRIAYRVVKVDDRYRYAAIAAAVFAGLGMYGIQDSINGALSSYMHYVLSVQSDPMIVTLVLAAIDLHMSKHRRWVIVMLTLAGLGRPEVWPILALYSLWCLIKRPDMRLFIAGAAALTLFLWFGVPTITNGRPFVAGDLAQGSPRACGSGKIICTLDRFKALNLWPVWVFALAAVAWAGYRLWRARADRVAGAATLTPAQQTERSHQLLVMGLVGGIVIWMLVEVAFALKGFPAVPRYIFEPAVVAIVLGGIAFGWLLREIPSRLRLPSWSGVGVAVLLALALVPGALSRTRNEHKDIRHERIRTASIGQLAGVIDRLGGRQAVLNCGRPVTNVEYVSILGWLTHQNDGKIGHRPQFELHQKYPIVLFTQLPNGWATWPWHTAKSKLAACQKIKAVYAVTPGHPDGVLVRNRIAPKAIPPIPDTPTAG
ncbi:MAG: hypothetical protein ACR2NR_20555 [Solirubrobacteraceae bacterium]